MREQLTDGTTIICLATMLNSTPTGNMFPSFKILEDATIILTNFYCVDFSEFIINKLIGRGSISVKSLIINSQNFIRNVEKGL